MLTRIVSHVTFPSIVFTVAVLALAAAPFVRPSAAQPTIVVVPAPVASTTIVNAAPVITPVYYPAYPYYWGNWRSVSHVCYYGRC